MTEKDKITNNGLEINHANIYFILSIRYGCIMIIAFGTLGNITSILTFCNKNMRRKKIVPYIIVLAVVDTISIVLNCSRNVFVSYTLLSPTLVSNIFTSESYHIVAYFFTIYSSWITVVISIERLGAILCPFSKMYSSRRYKPYIVLFALLVSVAVPYAILMILLNNFEYKMFVATITYSFIPAIILLIMSIVMIYKILQPSDLGQNVQRRSTTQSKNSVYLVIAINSVFFIATFPVSIYYILWIFKFVSNLILLIFLDVLSAINNGINIVLYVAVSKSFRTNLKGMCCKNLCDQR